MGSSRVSGQTLSKDGKPRKSYRWVRGLRTRKEAQTELNKLLKSIDDGAYVEVSKQTVAEYLERWLNTVKPNLAGKTFERYKQIVEVNINPVFGLTKLAKLQPVQIAESSSTRGR
ncbi:MAG: hypothetical protein JOY54_08200 [Acidobacteriaceae bacterium]|nr:hypothetical protein [Acidobacteriaceae bacterium]